MKYLLAFLTIIVLSSCKTQQPTATYQQIEYEAGPCFGFCPIFKLTINSDRSAVLEAEHFNFSKNFGKEEFSNPREGTFTTTIKPSDYDTLTNLITKLNVKSLKDLYKDKLITDLPTSHLRVKFADGSSKSIEDYGKKATPELVEVYQFLEALKHNQTWKKVK